MPSHALWVAEQLIFFKTGMFHDEIKVWQATPDDTKTWPTFQIFFCQAHPRYRRQQDIAQQSKRAIMPLMQHFLYGNNGAPCQLDTHTKVPDVRSLGMLVLIQNIVFHFKPGCCPLLIINFVIQRHVGHDFICFDLLEKVSNIRIQQRLFLPFHLSQHGYRNRSIDNQKSWGFAAVLMIMPRISVVRCIVTVILDL
jgi:hypothetical protein